MKERDSLSGNRTNHDRLQRHTWPHLYNGSSSPMVSQIQIAHLNQTVEFRCHLFGGDGDINQRNANEPQDLISLILWYKGDNPSAIYTLDARQVASGINLSQLKDKETGSGKADNNTEPSFGLLNRHLVSEARLYTTLSLSKRERLQLDRSSEFPVIKLQVKSAEAEDSGQYKCRVDFRRSPSHIQSYYLQVQGKLLHFRDWIYIFTVSDRKLLCQSRANQSNFLLEKY